MMHAEPVFGSLLRRLRLEADLSQESLAERARVSKQAISSLERGARRAPQRRTLALLADALSLDETARRDFEAAASASSPSQIRHRAGDGEPARLAISTVDVPRPALLPENPTSFVGRKAECEELAAKIRPGNCVTVWGSGGVGKTRLSLETARTIATRFPAGLWFVELAELSEHDDVVRAIAAVVETPETFDGSLVASVVAACNVAGLLLLDNAEHLIAACAGIIARLLREAPALAIVCTSREPLRVPGEHVFHLEGLPVPDSGDVALERPPAVRLFLDRAASAGISFAPADLPGIAAICDRLDAIPLALELAAARTPLMSIAQIESGLDDRFRMLRHGSRVASPRHQTLQGALDWSYALLTAIQRTVLRSVGIWPGTWSLEDAVCVAGGGPDDWTIVDAVGDLVDRSLVIGEQRDADRRFRLLQSTRAYALERAANAGELERIERLLAERMLELCTSACEAWRGGDDEPFRRLDIPALRAALRWTITQRNDVRLGALSAGEAGVVWEFRGTGPEGLQWIDEALAALDPSDVDARLRALIGRARLARRLYLHQQTFDAAREAATLAERLGDTQRRAIALTLTGESSYFAHSPAEGRDALNESLRLFKELGDERGGLGATYELAFMAFREGDFASARDRFAEVVAHFRARGNVRAATEALIDLAEADFHLGNVHEAVAHAGQGLDAARRLSAPRLIVIASLNLAAYLLAADDIPKAVRIARSGLLSAVDANFGAHTAFALNHVADALSRADDPYDAALIAGSANALLEKTGTVRQGTEERGYTALMRRLANAYTPAELDALLSEGAQLSISEVVAVAFDATDQIFTPG